MLAHFKDYLLWIQAKKFGFTLQQLAALALASKTWVNFCVIYLLDR
uniref:Uncharacterized protein n=1 Tax=Arundo donax TaxID=35708 RepID=A0A0A8YNC2_ARUDO